MLTREESLRFIKDVLKIPNEECELKRNKLSFLNRLIASISSIPFQSVTLIGKPFDQRRRPSLEEVKTSMIERKGGMCYTLNAFTYCLLKSIGYDVDLNISTVPICGVPFYNHLIVFAYNLKETGDMYLVDTGSAYANFEAICLDFETESPIYSASFLRYKFVKIGNKIQCLHDRSGFELSPGKPTQTEPFELFYEFEVKPTKDLNAFNNYFDAVYTSPEQSPFHKSLRAIKFINRRLIVICNTKIAIESESGEISVTTLKDDQELLNAYGKYFPELDASVVQQAIYNWRNDTY